MQADELFQHALTSLPEAVGDLLRGGRDPGEFVFASFDGASELGKALIASDMTGDDRDDVAPPSGNRARREVERMVHEASARGEELIVSLMVTRDALARMLTVSSVDASGPARRAKNQPTPSNAVVRSVAATTSSAACLVKMPRPFR